MGRQGMDAVYVGYARVARGRPVGSSSWERPTSGCAWPWILSPGWRWPNGWMTFAPAGGLRNGVAGGTVPTGYLELVTAATELRPGTDIYNDAATILAGAAQWADCRAWVWTTVVSTSTPDRAVVDAGSKSLAGGRPVWTSPRASGSGRGVPVRGARRDSHTRWGAHPTAGGQAPGRRSQPANQPSTQAPNQVCTMINLHDAVHSVEGRRAVGWFAVDLRGAVP